MSQMTRRFAAITIGLAMAVGAMIGLVLAGSMTPQQAVSAPASGRAASVSSVRRSALSTAPSFADIAEQLNPSVVTIDASARGLRYRRPGASGTPEPSQDPLGRNTDRDRDGPRRGAGTGFLVDAQGYILTNHHVVDGAERIIVRLSDSRSLRARLVGSDPDTDIALIKIDSPTALPFATLGDSDTLRVGEWVVAIGNPLAYEHTVTVGVVSFIGRKLFDSSFDRYIQTDAAINLGNSGGPLINARGEVVGINAMIFGGDLAVSIPSHVASEWTVAPTRGRTYLGASVAPAEFPAPLRKGAWANRTAGLLVVEIAPAGPAARAGLAVGDLLLDAAGTPLDGIPALRELLTEQAGRVVRMYCAREGAIVPIDINLGERGA
jgi:serine protease Do